MSTALVLRRDIDHGIIERAALAALRAATVRAIRAGRKRVKLVSPHATSLVTPLLNVTVEIIHEHESGDYALVRSAKANGAEPFAVWL
jgi:hypothetical protein